VVLDNLSEGHREFVKWGTLVEADLRDREALFRAVAESGAETIVHFAAYAYVGESVRDPAKYWLNNVAGSLNLMDAAVNAKIDRFVFSSTCATYGVIASDQPITESTVQNPINPYGQTKLATERMISDYCAALPINAVFLRYFNAAGADPDLEVGEDHRDETHLIPLAILAAMGKAPKLRVFGSDYDTPDGSAVRDYVHVCDLAKAHVLALNYLARGGETDAFNIGAGRGISVFEILNEIKALTGKEVPSEVVGRRAGDPAVLVSDTSKARARLGFETELSEISTIIKTAWDWHAQRH
jgi:UDP-glucose-4-epimerase GalE